MLILLEGPDGVGKSTYADALQTSLRKEEQQTVIRLHKGPIKEHPLDEYVDELRDFNPVRQIAICDRWHVGEQVYGPILRGRCAYDEVELLYIEMFLRSRGAINVMLTETWEILEERYRRDGDELVDAEQLFKVFRAYQAIQAMPRDYFHHGFVVDRPTKTGQAGVISTLEIARRFEQQVAHLEDHPVYVGTPRPKVLLVGETRNLKAGSHPTAFTPMPNTSGRYLLECLVQAIGFTSIWDRVGITNALEDDVEDLFNSFERPPRVVALGAKAHSELIARGVHPSHTLDHPQYRRRFMRKQTDQYVQQLAEACA